MLLSIVLTAIAPSGSSVILGLGDRVHVDFEARAQFMGDIASSLTPIVSMEITLHKHAKAIQICNIMLLLLSE